MASPLQSAIPAAHTQPSVSSKMSQGRNKTPRTETQATNVSGVNRSPAQPRKILKGHSASALKMGEKHALVQKLARNITLTTARCVKTVNYNLIVSASCTYWGEKYFRQGLPPPSLPSVEVPMSGRHSCREKYCTTILLRAPPNNTHTKPEHEVVHSISTSVEGEKILGTSFYKPSWLLTIFRF